LLASGLVGLRDDGHDRSRAERAELRGEVLIARPDPLSRRNTEPNHVNLGQRRAGQAVQALAEQCPRPMQARRVNDDELGVWPMDNTADRPARRLRFAAGNCHLRAHQGVHER
jgi:hypothetical protein